LALVAIALATVVYLLPAKEIAIDLITRIRSAGVIAPVVFFFIYLVAAVLGFSRTVLAIVAGVAFNPVVAFSVVLAAMMASFMCTYVLARYFLADWVTARLEKIPVARKLLAAVEGNGFRMLVMMRLNPRVPGVVNGYGFGLTSIKPITYFLASVVGSIPLTLIHLYLGWAGGEAILRSGGQAEKLQEGTMLFGVCLSVVMLIAITWYGRRLIAAVGAPIPDQQ
jgi:uncharacterized membrane protein YdjX (TVP38/TMEM64 family)